MKKVPVILFVFSIVIIQAQWSQPLPSDQFDYFTVISTLKMVDFQPLDTSGEKQSKALLLSLVWPGAGQLYNHDPLWKPILFSAIEIAGIASNIKWKQTSNRLRWKFESFADDHWELQRWYENTKTIFPGRWQEMVNGTHKLTLEIDGNFESTNHLIELLKNTSWEQIQVVRDRDFYENIGKYDQFVGGWDDPYDDPFDSKGNWFTVTKGNSDETFILTKRKDNYRGIRHRSNLYTSYAKYAATTLMFNHLISGVEASGLLKRKQEKNKLKTDFSLMFLPQTLLGVGGVRLNIYW